MEQILQSIGPKRWGGNESALLPTLEEWKKYSCEFWGTFLLSFFIPWSLGYGKSEFAPIAGGFLLSGIIYAIGPKSGGHVNPALTITLFLADPSSFPLKDLFNYVLYQLAGGICGAFLAAGSVENSPTTFHIAFTNSEVNHVELYQAFGAEVLGVAFFFWLIIQIAADTSNAYYALAIGFVNIATVVVLAPISGAGLNPAVVLGNNLVADVWGSKPAFHGSSLTWTRTTLYALAEILGGIMALVLLSLTTYVAPEPEEVVVEGKKTGGYKRQSLLMAVQSGGGAQWSQPTPVLVGEEGSRVEYQVPAARRRASLLMPVPAQKQEPVTEKTPLRRPSAATSEQRSEFWDGKSSSA
mmetsp:Transcript_93023/g.206954  ORF Transcript_93023/g.206954 Transcript_93023/m.206954 type:complete len:354 (+) Transcript_93023:83-1144(+)